MYSYETVSFDGEPDTTLGLVRKGLPHSGAPLYLQTRQDKTNRVYSQDIYIHKNHIPGDWDDFFEVAPTSEPAHPKFRTHSCIVQETHGWSISQFASLQELVEGLHDAVRGRITSFIGYCSTFLILYL